MQYNFIVFLVDIRHISIDPISSYSMMKHFMPFIVTVFKNDLSGLSFNLSKAALMAEEKVEPSACIDWAKCLLCQEKAKEALQCLGIMLRGDVE